MKKLSTILPLVFLAAALSAASSVQAQKRRSTTKTRPPVVTASVTVKPGPQSPTDVKRERRIRAFTTAWSIIKYQYFDKTYGGLDWDAVYKEYIPRVNAATTDTEVHDVILEMIGRLNKSHFGLVPPEYYDQIRKARAASRAHETSGVSPDGKPSPKITNSDEDEDDLDDLDEAPPGRYGVGINIRVIGDQFIITSVNAGSAAAEAGVKPGFALDKINGVSMTELVRTMSARALHIRHFERFLPTLITGWILNSDTAAKVQLTCLDGSGAAQTFDIQRKALAGQPMSMGDAEPSMFFEYESRLAAPDVAYVKFNLFAWQVLGKFCDTLTTIADKKALIVDLRGNIGGLLFAMQGLAGMLQDERGSLGTAAYRSGPSQLTIEPKKKTFKGRVIFLVDDQSMSASELLSAGLQDNGRILVVGQRTAGEALPAITTRLATGAVFMYPIANYISPAGKVIEGTGVEPDISVPLDRTALLAGSDPQLERAVALANDDGAFAKLAKLKIERSQAAVKTAAVGLDELPPPPKPLAAKVPASPSDPPPKLTSIERGLSSIPSRSQAPPFSGMDPRAVKILSDFIAVAGGPAAIHSYEAAGVMRISIGSQSGHVRYRTIWAQPDKFVAVVDSDVMGEIREVHDGKNIFMESNTGFSDTVPKSVAEKSQHLFSELFELMSPGYFKALKYEGQYESDGKMVQTISAVTSKGEWIAMTFDPASRTLVRVAQTGPGITTSFSDYRKVGDLLLPFKLLAGGIFDFELKTLTVNQPVDPSNFEKKENCFDKP